MVVEGRIVGGMTVEGFVVLFLERYCRGEQVYFVQDPTLVVPGFGEVDGWCDSYVEPVRFVRFKIVQGV